MQLTLHTDYALRVLLYIRLHPARKVTILEMAQGYDISKNHLMKVVQKLVKLGYLESVRGRGGGLTLAQPPEQINLGMVVIQMEPSLNLVECFDLKQNTCPIEPACDLKHILYRAQQAFLTSLKQHTLADLASQPEQLQYLLYPVTLNQSE